jgi:membrane fusion protein (multidrug efflux system)
MMTPPIDAYFLKTPRSRIVRLLGGTLLILPLAACIGNSPAESGHSAQTGIPAMPVSVTVVHKEMLPVALEAVGQTEGSREVNVQARVSGLLERTLFKEGEPVKAGAPLVTIERAAYENALQQARAELAQRQVQAEQTHREAQRLKALAEDKAISQREYDDAVSSERLAAAALESARAALRNAELNLSYTSVTAPISGVTGRAAKSQGNLLTPGSDGQLTTITQTDPLWVRFSLSADEANRLRQSKKADVKLTTSSGQQLLAGGRLNFSASTVDTRMGTVQLRAEFANPDLAVMPGQFVRVQLLAGETAAFRVPQVAVTQTEEGRLVWIARDGKAVQAPVETGPWVGNEWSIYKGLADGDQVITDNLIKLRPDAPVTPRAAVTGSNAAPAASN